jgi:hypothetical protein
MMPLSRVPRARQDHAIGNLIEDHPMTALGNVPCNGSRACCLHDMTRPMPERGDLIWIFEHEVMATAAGPTAILQCFLSKCFLSKCFLSKTRPEQSPAKMRPRCSRCRSGGKQLPTECILLFRWTRII